MLKLLNFSCSRCLFPSDHSDHFLVNINNLTCSGRPKGLAKGQAPDRGARRHAAKGVRRLAERREALLARGVHGNKANVATARELACWVWAVGLMAEEA